MEIIIGDLSMKYQPCMTCVLDTGMDVITWNCA